MNGVVQRMDVTGMPGLRVFGSQGFRLALALTLSALGVYLLLLYPSLLSAIGHEGGYDFFAYLAGSERWLEVGSPYTVAQVTGAAEAYCPTCYIYPPPLAQLLSPLTLVPAPVAEFSWYSIQFVAMYAALWIGTGLGGARRSLERALWCLVPMLWFMPAFSSFWYGNISTVLALGATLVAAGGAAAGASAVLLTLLKVSPASLVPVALLMGRESRWAVVISLVVALGISFALAPGAWLDYPRILLDLAASGHVSIAPANIAARSGLPDGLVLLTRLATLTTGGVAFIVSLWLARRREGWPEAAFLATVAALTIRGTLLYHYLVVLLPFAAIAWPKARPATRFGLLISAGVVSVSFGVDPLALAGGTAMSLIIILALWPRRAPAS